MAELYHNILGEEVSVNQLTAENAEAVTLWCHGFQVEEIDALEPDKRYVGINIQTIAGGERASEGDYIIQDANGRFWPCKPYSFHSLYQKVD